MTEVPEADREVGIEVYSTPGDPCTARAKTLDEDFRVEEKLDLAGLVEEGRPDYFPLYRVEKKGIDTLHLEKEVGEALKSRVSFAGLKDKRSVSVQYVTPTSRRSARPENIQDNRFSAKLVGFLPRPLSRSLMVGNGFAIRLRECCRDISARVEEAYARAAEKRIANFYGLQRFGRGAGSHMIGKAMLQRRFEDAVRLMLEEPGTGDGQEAKAAREAMAAGRYEEGVRLLSHGQDVERAVAGRLARRPGEWVWALRAASLRLRRLYVHAYQSYIFNRTMSEATRKGLDISSFESGDNWGETSDGGWNVRRVHGVREPPIASSVPLVQLVGYAYRDYGSRFDAIIGEVLAQEGVAPRDFYIDEMQEASAEGGFRLPHMLVRGSSYKAGEAVVDLRFELPRGQYATVLLREVVKPSDPAGAGLG